MILRHCASGPPERRPFAADRPWYDSGMRLNLESIPSLRSIDGRLELVGGCLVVRDPEGHDIATFEVLEVFSLPPRERGSNVSKAFGPF